MIDVTRCSVALADPADLMEAFQLLTSQESQDGLNYKIVRFKNKFHPSSNDTFKNIMVNALVRGEPYPTTLTSSISSALALQGQRSVDLGLTQSLYLVILSNR